MQPFGEHDLILLGLPGGFQPGGAVITDANGQPRRKYVKDLVRVGEFVKSSNGQKISISADHLSTFEASTKAYIANGNKVTLPAGHDLSGDPGKNRGFVLDVFVEGDTLYGLIEAVGNDAIAAASRSHVSIYSPPKWTDGAGKNYDWPIRHVALTTDPVINQQGDFLPIAASQGTVMAEVISPVKETIMDLKKIQKKLGIKTELTEANATDAICAAFDAPDMELTLAQAEITKLKADLAAAQTVQPKELSHTERGLARRLIDGELQARVKDGNITPGVAEKIKTVLIGSDMMLAFGPSGDPTALAILDALKGNDPVKLGEQTGRQVVELAHRKSSDEAVDQDIEAAAVAAKEWAKREFKVK